MPIMVVDLDDGITRVILSDRMDAAGAVESAMEMYYVGESANAVIIDLARVTFIASLALRNIVSLAKSVIKKKGKVVMLAPQPSVEEVLITSGLDMLMEIHRDQASAVAALRL
jgi:anti-anti-sigma factor